MEYAREDDKFLPPFVPIKELEKDWIAVKSILSVLKDLQQMQSNLDDTVMIAGSEACVGALSYYHSVKYETKFLAL